MARCTECTEGDLAIPLLERKAADYMRFKVIYVILLL